MSSTSGNIHKNFLTQIEVIDFYFSKIETYLGHKHRNSLQRMGTGTDSNYSGSPKSSFSDRPHTTIEDEMKNEFEVVDNNSNFKRQSKRFEFPNDEEDEVNSKRLNCLINSDRGGLKQSESLQDDFEKKALFKDFTEPDVYKTGYLIPLSCGHNGQMTINEKTIYEIHLTNAGFIQEHDLPNMEQVDDSLDDSQILL
jgi:hypothetical protein